MRFASVVLIVLATVGLAVPSAFAGAGEKEMAAEKTSSAPEQMDIVDTAVAAGSFETLAAALTEAGLVEVLKGEGPFTVLAPSDGAFGKLPEGTVENLLKPENSDQLVSVLTYHVVPGEYGVKEIVAMDAAKTLNGQRVDITDADGRALIDKATVVKSNIRCSNGVIHVIDTVLMPVDATIVEVASATGKFETLLAAAKAAGLAEALMGDGPFTVFAPTDEAFAKLPEGTVESLLEEENKEELQTILRYHIVSGRVFSDEVLKAESVETLAGMDVEISVKDGKAMAGDAHIVKTDIDASNGVIHVVDGVLMPPM